MSDQGAAGRGGQRFPRDSRITASEEIRTLFRRGKRKKTRHLDVFVSPSPVGRSRLGLVVPRHKRPVVERNRLKRRLRELGRIRILPALRNAGATLDVMIRTRPEAYGATFEALREEVERLTEELCSSER